MFALVLVCCFASFWAQITIHLMQLQNKDSSQTDAMLSLLEILADFCSGPARLFDEPQCYN